MKKIIFKSILLVLLFAVQIKIHAQYKQYKPPAAKETVIQKPYYGAEETLIGAFWKSKPNLSFNMETATEMPYEFGYVFTTAKKGAITHFAVRMPRTIAAGPVLTYTVSLWDYDTRQLIKQSQVDVTDVRLTTKALDEEIHITAGKKYVLSVFIKPVNSTENKWLYYNMISPGNNNSAAPFIPFTQGNLTLLNTQFTQSATPAFPATVSYHKDIMSGICDVVFKAMEQ
ncbi:hypothetical protein [Ferruginibacter sp.]